MGAFHRGRLSLHRHASCQGQVAPPSPVWTAPSDCWLGGAAAGNERSPRRGLIYVPASTPNQPDQNRITHRSGGEAQLSLRRYTGPGCAQTSACSRRRSPRIVPQLTSFRSRWPSNMLACSWVGCRDRSHQVWAAGEAVEPAAGGSHHDRVPAPRSVDSPEPTYGDYHGNGTHRSGARPAIHLVSSDAWQRHA